MVAALLSLSSACVGVGGVEGRGFQTTNDPTTTTLKAKAEAGDDDDGKERERKGRRRGKLIYSERRVKEWEKRFNYCTVRTTRI